MSETILFQLNDNSPDQMECHAHDLPDLGSDQYWSIRKKTLKTGRSAGIDLIEVDNGAQTLLVIPTRGMGLWKIETENFRLGWDSPVDGPVHPGFVDLTGRNQLGWLDGFDELIARCGLTSNGPPGHDEHAPSPVEAHLSLHGRIANLPARDVAALYSRIDGKPHLLIRGTVTESTLFGQRLKLIAEYQIPLGESRVILSDQVVNCSAKPAELQLLYHINIGSPVLEAGSRWQAAVSRIFPKDDRALEGIDECFEYLGPTVDYAEQVYYCQPIADDDNHSLVMLTNATNSQGVLVNYDTSTLPCLSIWKNTQATEDGYCTGLEPATNYPNFKAQERREGRVVKLLPGQSWQTSVSLTVLSSAAEVTESQQAIAQLQSDHAPQIDRELTPGISCD